MSRSTFSMDRRAMALRPRTGDWTSDCWRYMKGTFVARFMLKGRRPMMRWQRIMAEQVMNYTTGISLGRSIENPIHPNTPGGSGGTASGLSSVSVRAGGAAGAESAIPGSGIADRGTRF